MRSVQKENTDIKTKYYLKIFLLDVVTYYLLANILFQPIEEIHNCNNPNLIGIVPHYVCVWEEEDFYTTTSGKKALRPKRKKDNYFKQKARERYWLKKQQGRG